MNLMTLVIIRPVRGEHCSRGTLLKRLNAGQSGERLTPSPALLVVDLDDTAPNTTLKTLHLHHRFRVSYHPSILTL
jgi:hypothetical protein